MARRKSRWWAWPSELRRRGILGINQRNAHYVLSGNPRSHYRRVDDKLLTKQICDARGIAVPQTFLALRRYGDVRKFADLLGDRREFVIKPAAGAEGRGIVVVVDREAGAFVTTLGARLKLRELQHHLSTILSGLYSLGGRPDQVIVEQRIVLHPAFQTIAVGGTPDIRIIVYRGVPAMAMVRLPTRASRGRANLHQGAVAAAIDLGTGLTFGGVSMNRTVECHPDTSMPVAGLEIPGWNALLDAAIQLADALELGYVGVDFVISATGEPVVLEANARPGLAIQIANRRGLVPQLAFIDRARSERTAPLTSPEMHGVDLG